MASTPLIEVRGLRKSFGGAPTGPGSRTGILAFLARVNPLLFALIVLFVVVALYSDRFLTFTNQMNITRQAAVFLIIAGVVLGGTALYGGVGTVVGTVLGIMTIGVLENAMVLVGADFHVQRVLIGVLLVSAVAYQGYRRRRQTAIPTN